MVKATGSRSDRLSRPPGSYFDSSRAEPNAQLIRRRVRAAQLTCDDSPDLLNSCRVATHQLAACDDASTPFRLPIGSGILTPQNPSLNLQPLHLFP